MKKQYVLQSSRWLLVAWVLCSGHLTRAQTQQPTIQWQRTFETNDLTSITSVRAVKISQGGYGLLLGKSVVCLSETGDVIWNKPVPATQEDKSVMAVPVRQTIGITPTPDGGVAILAQDTQNRFYVTKLNASGDRLWLRIIDRADTGAASKLTDNSLITTPDGSLLVAGAFRDRLSYVTLTRLNQEGVISGQWRINYTDAEQGSQPAIQSILNTADGGYLLAGKTTVTGTSKGLAIKLNKSYQITWKSTYPTVDSLSAIVAKPSSDNTYIAIGSSAGGNARLLTISPLGKEDGNQIATFAGSTASARLVNSGTGYTILDATGAPANNFRLQGFSGQLAPEWTKTVGGSGNDLPADLLANSDGGYLALGTTTSTDGDVTGRSGNTTAVWLIKFGSSATATTLRLTAPTYNCQTGAIVFNTTGGNGTPILYSASGITRATLTDNFGIVEQELRNDPKTVIIQATQSGQTVNYAFDLATVCPNVQQGNSSASTLKLAPPTYNCSTGAITFHAIGGDGSPIEFAAAGITNWTTNPNQRVDAELRTAYDAKPITILARQGDQVASYVLDLKAACARARLAANEPSAVPSVAILGNPVSDLLTVEVTGIQKQSLVLRLTDDRGRLVEQRLIEQPMTREQQTFDVRKQGPGMLFLHTTISGQQQTIKVIKH
ncbi:hypothetical protein M0L20_24610 [Spirosoma sp. RP8]|uniref:T9SS type A sorting domain-containing protein n=1 Tax=Spirosoma liriopis TaxID=2937440 RepID=A0ABT0HSB9_9BACT|nr:hypothetical protein [Spirosoma liriopis]MCK8495077.1 hypothetical protein [Spirosoma liriopis]